MHARRWLLIFGVAFRAQAQSAPARTPVVTGPIIVTAKPGDPSHNYPFGSTVAWLEPYDYREDEFYVEGMADAFTADGLTTGVVAPGGPYAYKTRVTVRRPRDAARFNGTVILEWINGAGTQDQENEWCWSHEHLMRAGYTYVGVSAQSRSITAPSGLKAWNPARYGALDVNAGGQFTFQLSNDIYTQVARALKQPGAVPLLGPLRVRSVIAAGHSSSSARLAYYYNSIHPLARVLDGFVLHAGGVPIRSDIRTPSWRILSETDLGVPRIAARAGPRQPDTPYLRTWEMAGAAHAGADLMDFLLPLLARDLGPSDSPKCDRPMLSRVPSHYVQDAAYDWMKRWIEQGVVPPHAPPIAQTADNGVIVRDEFGIARGGIRLAHVAVPIATNTGINSGEQFCDIMGASLPFADTTLARLYPTHTDYVRAVERITDENLKAGYITKDAAAEIKREAARSNIGKRDG